jgi:glycerol-3-phosphate dehydrogenase
MSFTSRLKVLAGSLAACGSLYAGVRYFSDRPQPLSAAEGSNESPVPLLTIPTRSEQIARLRAGEEFDILIIGGGATGSGIALDSVLRGFNTALIERYDFSSGTSSRSTKLIHGGVRYLEKAIKHFDYEQYKLVKEALHERANLLKIAPHLSAPLPIMLPVYRWWQVPYFWVGIKAYDMIAGRQLVKSSYYVSKSKALEEFPMLKDDRLCGGIVYYDGQHNDARMNLAIALTAAREGATVTNHVEAIGIIKEQSEEGKEVVRGVRMRDALTGEEWDVRAKVVINATGPFVDKIRHMDDPEARNLVMPSAGLHIVLPGYYSPRTMGLLDPATSDGRVIFFLPWENLTIAGTTDSPTELTHLPMPREEDIKFILSEIKAYLSPNLSVRRGDVLAAWSGIRPLVFDPNKADTQSVARNHIIEVRDSRLITISGGKWTTYRSMAKDAVDKAVEVGGLGDDRGCLTDGFFLVGAGGWSPTLFIRLIQDYGFDIDVAKNLANTYGDQAPEVAKLAALTGRRWPVVGLRLSQEFPYIEAEVKYAVREYACTAIDVLARRTRLAFLNVQAAHEALPRIVEIMAAELGWDKNRKKHELERAQVFLETMGYKARTEVRDVNIDLSYQEAKEYGKIFRQFDKDRDGHISIHDLRKALHEMGASVTEEELRELISEVDINQNATIEEEEFLKMMSALKTGEVANSRMASIVQRKRENERKISVDRSGGGL